MIRKGVLIIFSLCFIVLACSEPSSTLDQRNQKKEEQKVSIILLGTFQDAGSPQIGCKKSCCEGLFEAPDPTRKVISIGIIDHHEEQQFLIEATPDIASQIHHLDQYSNFSSELKLDGVFLTHGHIGHYSGLQFLGKEAMDANQVPVYAMPKMKSYLEHNGPWDQLVKRENIRITALEQEKRLEITPNVHITPFLVPHRDEYSETVGYKIIGPTKSALFIPDIDKWSKWDKSIIEEIQVVDFAFLDATFYSGIELNNRDMSEIPHPFILESMDLFNNLNEYEKQKIFFIHFNHTNPVINMESDEAKNVIGQGFQIGQFLDVFDL